MSGGFPIIGDICNAQSFGVGTYGAEGFGQVITSGSNNTKGSWTQLSSSTSSDIVLLEVEIVFESAGGANSFSLDIGIGASGSEVIIIPDLFVGQQFNRIGSISLIVPVQIPAGTRVAARGQCNNSSKTAAVILRGYDGGLTQSSSVGRVESIGFTAASTTGTAITPNSTAATYGAYAQLVASTPNDYIALFGTSTLAQSSGSMETWLIDIAIGASGSEIPLLPQRQLYGGDSINSVSFFGGFTIIPLLPIQIPAGTRISARCMSSLSSGSTPSIVLYGVY